MKARLREEFVAYDEPDELSTRKVVGRVEKGTNVWITFYDESEVWFDVHGEDSSFRCDQSSFEYFFEVLQSPSDITRQVMEQELFNSIGPALAAAYNRGVEHADHSKSTEALHVLVPKVMVKVSDVFEGQE